MVEELILAELGRVQPRVTRTASEPRASVVKLKFAKALEQKGFGKEEAEKIAGLGLRLDALEQAKRVGARKKSTS